METGGRLSSYSLSSPFVKVEPAKSIDLQDEQTLNLIDEVLDGFRLGIGLKGEPAPQLVSYQLDEEEKEKNKDDSKPETKTAQSGFATTPGDRVNHFGDAAFVVKAEKDGKVLIYVPSKAGLATGLPEPKKELLETSFDRVDVVLADGRKPDGMFYRHKASGAMIKVEAGMQFPAEELVVVDAKDLRKGGEFGPLDETGRRVENRDINLRRPSRPLTMERAEVDTRSYNDGVSISTPTSTTTPTGEKDFNPQRDIRLYCADKGKKEIPLYRNGQWLQISSDSAQSSDVKAHIKVTSCADKARIDKLLIPLLYDAIHNVPGSTAEKLGLTRLVTAAKLKDPLDRDSRFRRLGFDQYTKLYTDYEGAFTGSSGQNAKGYTIYGRTASDVEKIARIIDQYLAEQSASAPELVLRNDTASGNLSDCLRLPGSNRVSISRESWALTESAQGRWGADLEEDLGLKAKAQYGKSGKLTQDDLDRLAKDAGIKPGLLGLDKDERLMLFSSPADRWMTGRGQFGDIAYLDEASANRTNGQLEGRPAAYALYRHLNKDGPESSKDPAQYVSRAERDARRAYFEAAPFPIRYGSADFRHLQILRQAILSGDVKALQEELGALAKMTDSARAERIAKAFIEDMRKYGVEVSFKKHGSDQAELTIRNQLNKYGLSVSTDKPPAALSIPPSEARDTEEKKVQDYAQALGKRVGFEARYATYDPKALKQPEDKIALADKNYIDSPVQNIDTETIEFRHLQILRQAALSGDVKALNQCASELALLSQERAAKVLDAFSSEMKVFAVETTFEQTASDSASGRIVLISLKLKDSPGSIMFSSGGDATISGGTQTAERFAQNLSTAVRSAAPSLMPGDGEYKGDSTGRGLESLSGTTARDASLPISIIGGPADRFTGAPEDLTLELRSLNEFIEFRQRTGHERYSYTPQEIKLLLDGIKRGSLEYFSVEDAKKIVEHIREVIDHNALSLNNEEFFKLDKDLTRVEKCFNTYQEMANQGDTNAWKKTWLMHNLDSSDKESAERQLKSIEIVRKHLASNIPCGDAATITQIRARLGLEGENGTKTAFQVFEAARSEFAKRSKKTAFADCLTAAEISHLAVNNGGRIKLNITTILGFVQQAHAVSKDLTPKDIFAILELRQDFIDCQKQLKGKNQRLDLSGVTEEAVVLEKIKRYVEDRALEAMLAPDSEVPADIRLKWERLDDALFKLGDKPSAVRDATASILTRQIETELVKDFLLSIKTRDLNAMSAEDAFKTLEMISQTARSCSERMYEKGTVRKDLMTAWRKALNEFADCGHLRINSQSFNDAEFEYIRQLTYSELMKVPAEQLGTWLNHTLTDSRMKILDAETRARLAFDVISAWKYSDNGKTIPATSLSKMLKAIDPDVVRMLEADNREWLSEIVSRVLDAKGASQNFPNGAELIDRSVERIVDRIAGPSLSDAAAKEFFGGLNRIDFNIALQHLRNRSSHLTIQGLNLQFDRIAIQLREAGMLSKTHVRGRPAERIKVVCTGNASEGEMLAYLMRKATGIQIDIVNVSDPSQLPDGKFLVLDKMPDGKLGEAIRARQAEGRALCPKSIQDFHNGLNLFDLDRAELGGKELASGRDKLVAAIKTAKEKANLPSETAVSPEKRDLSDKEKVRVKDAIRLAITEEIDVMRMEARLYLTRHATMSGACTFRQALALGTIFEHGPDFISFGDMLKDARKLYQDRIVKDWNPANCIFVTDIDSQGSGRLATRMMRDANNLSGKEFDKNFVTVDEAREMARRGDLAGKRLIAVDDCLFSGKSAERLSDALLSIAKDAKPGTAPELIVSGLRAFETGAQAARQHIGRQIKAITDAGGTAPIVKLEVGNPNLIRDSGTSLRDAVSTRPIARSLKFGVQQYFTDLFSDKSEWANSTVRSRVIYPHMVPNNNPVRMNDFFRLYIGIAGAHSESRFDDPRFDKYSDYRVKGIDRFGYVNDNLIRGGKPGTKQAVDRLAELGVKTVINLEMSIEPEKAEWYRANGIKVIHMPMQPSATKAADVEKVVKQIGESLKDGKVFVHCGMGRDRTSLVVAQYRVTQENWTQRDARAEMEEFGYSKNTKGVEHFYDLVPERTAIARISQGNGKPGSDLYQVQKRSLEELRQRYQKTLTELGVKTESPLRGEKNWSDFQSAVDKVVDSWTALGETFPETVRYREYMLEQFVTLRHEAARKMVEADGIEYSEAIKRIDLALKANADAGTPLNQAYRDFQSADAEAKKQFEQLRPVLDRRVSELTKSVNAYLEARNLPPLEIKWTRSIEQADSVYHLGEGVVLLKYSDLLDSNAFANLAERVFHEAGHHAQASEFAMAVAQQVTAEQVQKGGSNDPAAYRDLIKARIAGGQVFKTDTEVREGTRLTIEDQVLDQAISCLKARKPMSPDELKRADQLGKSFKGAQSYRNKFQATERDYQFADFIRFSIDNDPGNASTEALLKALAEPEQGRQLRESLFGESEIAKLPQSVREQIEIWSKANKNRAGEALDWDGRTARSVILSNLDQRLRAINTQRQALEEEYLRPLHELEEQLLDVEAQEARRQAAPERRSGPGSEVRVPVRPDPRVRPPTDDETRTKSDLTDGEKRRTDPEVQQKERPIDVASVELPGGLKVLVDKKLESKVAKAIEKYSQDAGFRELMEERIKRASGKTKEDLLKEYERYKALPAEQQAETRRIIIAEVVERHNARAQGGEYSGAKRALGYAGTAMVLFMALEQLLAHADSGIPGGGAPVKPTVKQ